MRNLTVVAMLLAATLAHAAPTSVLDPLVKIDVTNAPLSSVLKSLTGQTGVEIQAPWNSDKLTATLKVDGKPLRAAVRELCRSANLQVVNAGGGRIMLQPLGPKGVTAPIETLAEPYRVQLTDLTLQRIFRARLDGRFMIPNQRSAQLEVTVDSDTNLRQRALMGLAPDYEIGLDGVALKPLPNKPELTMLWTQDGQNATKVVRPDALPPDTDPLKSISFKGYLVLYPDAKERVFEYTDLTNAAQQQSEGDIDVTMGKWTVSDGAQPAGPVAGDPRMRRVTPVGGPSWSVEVTLSMPTDETLRERLNMSPRGMPGMPRMMLNRLGEIDGLAVVNNVVVEHNAAVKMEVNGVPVDPAGGAAKALPPMATTLAMPWYGGGADHPCLPAVVVETSEGKRAMLANGFNLSYGNDPTKRLTLKSTFICAAKGTPKSLCIGAVDYGKRTQRLPFAIKEAPLPQPAAR